MKFDDIDEQRRAILKNLKFVQAYGAPGRGTSWGAYTGLRHFIKDDADVIDSTARIVEDEPEPLALPAPKETTS